MNAHNLAPTDSLSSVVEQTSGSSHSDPDEIDYTRPADVHSLDEMDFHVRKVRELRAELERIENLYRAEMNRMRDRWQERRTILERAIDWHLLPVESYHRAHPKDRTITLRSTSVATVSPSIA
jgi:hypothetical protein